MEHRCRMNYAGVPSFFGLGPAEGHVPNSLASSVRPPESHRALMGPFTNLYLYQYLDLSL